MEWTDPKDPTPQFANRVLRFYTRLRFRIFKRILLKGVWWQRCFAVGCSNSSPERHAESPSITILMGFCVFHCLTFTDLNIHYDPNLQATSATELVHAVFLNKISDFQSFQNFSFTMEFLFTCFFLFHNLWKKEPTWKK